MSTDTAPNYDPRPLTIVEISEQLGISVRTMHRLLTQGCPAELVGKKLVFKSGPVHTWLAEIGWKKRPYTKRGA